MSTPQSWIVAKLALSTNLAPEKCQKVWPEWTASPLISQDGQVALLIFDEPHWHQVVDAKETANAIKDFLSKDGPERIFFFYQAMHRFSAALCHRLASAFPEAVSVAGHSCHRLIQTANIRAFRQDATAPWQVHLLCESERH